MKIAIMGAGAFGTALGGVLASKGFDLDYYDSVLEHKRLRDVIHGAKITILAVPSEAAPYLLPYLPKDIPLVVATKGLLRDEYFAPFLNYSIISGPGYADDIKAGRPVKLTATDNWVIDLFTTSYLSFDKTQDKRGVLMCGSLKNVYAILAGFRNLKPGTAEHNLFLAAATNEMKSILSENGAKPETVDLACGKGDLEITCGLPSRNYDFGQKLRNNPHYQTTKTVEGISTLKKICRGEIKVPEDTKFLRELIRLEATWG